MADGLATELLAATGGSWVADRSADAVAWTGGAIDTRRITGGEVFFALPGERVDGHDYVQSAFAAGASLAVVHREVEAAGPLLRVADTYTALHDVTRAVRRRVPQKLVAITGSVGKTTTKELLAEILARRVSVARSPGNFNNLYGFPVALLGVPDDTEWMVAEMGMSTPGELGEVSRLGRPDAAVYTNVRSAHLERFGTRRAIAEAKAELLTGLAEGGLLVANADDDEVMRIAQRHAREHAVELVTYGVTSPAADLRAEQVRPEVATIDDRVIDGSRSILVHGGARREVLLAAHGLYNVENLLAAAACALSLGLSLDDVADAAQSFRPAAMRGEVHRSEDGPTIIDDSYNSNPEAAVAAIASAAEVPARRRLAVLGDMLELGPTAPELHRGVGRAAGARGFEIVLGVGELARHVVDAARDAGVADASWSPDAASAAERLRQWHLSAGDLVLVKGSRGIGLDLVVRELLSDGGNGGGC
ncbi:MAG: UDP-N-acetylmuramoyl-tripeptide--D-alanyl-D-alanine ligase [Acidobacteriota bacterium]